MISIESLYIILLYRPDILPSQRPYSHEVFLSNKRRVMLDKMSSLLNFASLEVSFNAGSVQTPIRLVSIAQLDSIGFP